MFKDKKRVPYSVIILGLGILLIVAIAFSFFLGRYPINPSELFGILLSRVVHIKQFWTDQMATILFNVRLPRILLACLVGCCLSAAGASYQGIFQNPMAAPDILGATAGAAFGAALAILRNQNHLMIMLYAFVFSLITVVLVYFISKKAQGKQVLGLILAGIMIGSLFSAGTSYIKLVADTSNQLPAITYWLMGSLSGATTTTVAIVLIRWHWDSIPFSFYDGESMY